MLNKEIIQYGKDKVLFEVINARDVIVSSSTSILKVESLQDFYKTILSIKFEEGKISLFDKLPLPIDAELTSIYKIKSIDQISRKTFKLTTDSINKTSNFLLPLLINNNLTKEFFLYDTYFYNAYITEDLRHLLLKYRYSESPIYQSFEKSIKNHPAFKVKDDSEYNFVSFTFSLEDITESKKVIDMFISGKYSLFPDKFKKDILFFYSYKENGSMYDILYRNERRRKQLEFDFGVEFKHSTELYSIPNLFEEVIYLS